MRSSNEIHKKPGPKPGHSKAIEERLRKLEAIVDALNINPDQVNIEHSPPRPSIKQDLSKYPQLEAVRQDLELCYADKINDLVCSIPSSQVLVAMRESDFLRYACYALASWNAPKELVPPSFSHQKQMAEAYFDLAVSVMDEAHDDPSYHAVLAFMILMIVGSCILK